MLQKSKLNRIIFFLILVRLITYNSNDGIKVKDKNLISHMLIQWCIHKVHTLDNWIYRPILRPNYLSKFVCTQWAVWLVYSSFWILVGWKFYCLTNSNASSVYTNLCTVQTSDEKSILLNCLMSIPIEAKDVCILNSIPGFF